MRGRIDPKQAILPFLYCAGAGRSAIDQKFGKRLDCLLELDDGNSLEKEYLRCECRAITGLRELRTGTIKEDIHIGNGAGKKHHLLSDKAVKWCFFHAKKQKVIERKVLL